ncbi:hypothetical protein NDU88_007924 [Pleurodeles waltl]|uniref:Uncharacterized protein n=1 Tax=Pleurodeles waltl TaxID=8319 RepID=A0AAV7QQF9_PLEWA|nr:hypothetical protein NDU88_007924 [Pleurodeles waltl]
MGSGADLRLEENYANGKAFATYYEGIYALGTLETEAGAADLLKDIQLPQLADEDREALEGGLTEEEVALVLQSLQSRQWVQPVVIKILEQEVRLLLWDGGSSHVAFTKGSVRGGLAVLDLLRYYWAAQLVTVDDWTIADQMELAFRVEMRWEVEVMSPHYIND